VTQNKKGKGNADPGKKGKRVGGSYPVKAGRKRGGGTGLREETKESKGEQRPKNGAGQKKKHTGKL